MTPHKPYTVRYAYDNPSSAGPFRGKADASVKYEKGEAYFGPFGVATVISCSKKRIANTK